MLGDAAALFAIASPFRLQNCQRATSVNIAYNAVVPSNVVERALYMRESNARPA